MLIDLSVPLDANTPVFPGDPPIAINQTTRVISDGYELHSITLGTHIGTHIDAPAHMLEGGQTLGQLPLETFVGAGTYIAAPGGDFSVAALEAAGTGIGAIVIFNTGTHKHYHEPDYFTDYPVLPPDVVDYLIAKKVKLVGLDTCSSDIGDDFPNHRALLGAGILLVENLTNVDALAGKTFKIYALPLRLDLDGAPARVIAEVL